MALQSGEARENQWGRAIVPFEMLSVLFQHSARDDRFPVRGPAVGLFADQEIRLVAGPLFVGEDLTSPGSDRVVATMLLHLASLKDSYAPYATEHATLYGRTASGD
jgi:hypothetical protein